MGKRAANAIALGFLWAAALSTVAVLGALIVYVVVNGVAELSPAFVFTWPEGVNMRGGIWPTIVATLYVTALAMLIVAPVAILAAVYLSEYAAQGSIVRVLRFAAGSIGYVQ